MNTTLFGASCQENAHDTARGPDAFLYCLPFARVPLARLKGYMLDVADLHALPYCPAS